MKTLPSSPFGKIILIASLALIAACSSAPPPVPPDPKFFKTPERVQQVPMASKEDMALIEEVESPIYTIGKGDVIRLEVMGRPEVSGKLLVGPDGRVTVPLVGTIKLEEQTRESAQEQIQNGLKRYYTHPVTTLTVDDYTSEYVTVLGRVERSGRQKFSHSPTLIEVLASAGAMPILDKQATLTKCAIIRGRQKLIWVDLKALLLGDPSYNLRLKKGDIVYVPDSAETAVYVMGQVRTPGSFRLRANMTVLDAISQAGGLHEDADQEEIGIYRPGVNQIVTISLKELLDPSRKANFALEDGDVLYIGRSGMGTFGYAMRQISPALSVLNFGVAMGALLRAGQ